VWNVFQKQLIKHTTLPFYFISDKKPENFGFIDSYIYDNNEPYYEVWIEALKKFNSKYFLYLQEDFLLYDNVNEKKINEYLEYLDLNENYSFVRLIKSGNLKNKKITDTLYEIESTNQDIFSMQSTIWKTDDYIKILEYVKDPKWLENEKYKNACIHLNIKGLYHYDNEKKRGDMHYDSNVYPYVATALVRGKWNLKEYKNELDFILNQNNINVNNRGIF
jgi:hypothetical protein